MCSAKPHGNSLLTFTKTATHWHLNECDNKRGTPPTTTRTGHTVISGTRTNHTLKAGLIILTFFILM